MGVEPGKTGLIAMIYMGLASTAQDVQDVGNDAHREAIGLVIVGAPEQHLRGCVKEGKERKGKRERDFPSHIVPCWEGFKKVQCTCLVCI